MFTRNVGEWHKAATAGIYRMWHTLMQKPIRQKPLIKCSQCQHRQLLPLTDQVMIETVERCKKELGSIHYQIMGPAPFSAVDFDGNQWQQDSLAFSKTCEKLNVPHSIEGPGQETGLMYGYFSLQKWHRLQGN